MNITTIAFDFGGVLVSKINDEYLCHMARLADARTDTFVTALWKYRNDYDSGELNAQAYWTSVLTASGGTTSPQLIDTLMHLDAVGWSFIRPAMLRWIATLKEAGFRRLIISNMAAETYDLTIRHSVLPAYFERVVLSGWLGINKPDNRIFVAATEEMGVQPDQMLFIDDLEHNVSGARAAGLHALQFTDPATLAGDLSEHYPDIPVTGLDCG